jgi:hypothetical protein
MLEHVVGVNADGTPFDGYMSVAEFAPISKQFTGKPWHACVRCGHVDKEGAMTNFSGKWFCNYSGCALEAQS